MAKGNQLFEVTSMPGYQVALKHFEESINTQIRNKSLNLEFTAGVQAVFDYFENGKTIADAHRSLLKKFEQVP